MKFRSIFKLSVHNLWQNKLRSFLTIIVLTIVSTLIVFLAGFITNFYMSSNKNIDKMFKQEGARISIEYSEYKEENGMGFNNQKEISIEKTKSKLKELEDMEFFNSIVLVGGNSGDSLSFCENTTYGRLNPLEYLYNVYPYSSGNNPFIGKSNYITYGRMWNASDEGSNRIWISNSLIGKYRLGQEVLLNLSEMGEKFIITGFIDNQAIGLNDTSNAIFLDIKHFNSTAKYDNYGASYRNVAKLFISSIEANLIPQDGVDFGMADRNKLNEVFKNNSFPKGATEGFEASCDLIESTKMVTYLFLGLLAVVAILGLIIILLSIGSVSNTIKITVEQNRRFFGMMKAIGMKNKTVRAVVNWQAVIMTFIGVAIASAIGFGLIVATKGLLVMLLQMVALGDLIVCTMSPYVPIVIFVVLTAFTLLFTRKSLMAVSKMDVISVISEVN